MRISNAGVHKRVEILAGNVGYLNMTVFFSSLVRRERPSQARWHMLRYADALDPRDSREQWWADHQTYGGSCWASLLFWRIRRGYHS